MFNFAKNKWFDYFRKIKNEEIKIDNKAKKEGFLYFITINYPTLLKKNCLCDFIFDPFSFKLLCFDIKFYFVYFLVIEFEKKK